MYSRGAPRWSTRERVSTSTGVAASTPSSSPVWAVCTAYGGVAERAVFPGLALYSTSKTALIGMTRGLARELGPRGITVNPVDSGPTDTDSNPAHGPDAAAIAGLTALGRCAEQLRSPPPWLTWQAPMVSTSPEQRSPSTESSPLDAETDLEQALLSRLGPRAATA